MPFNILQNPSPLKQPELDGAAVVVEGVVVEGVVVDAVVVTGATVVVKTPATSHVT